MSTKTWNTDLVGVLDNYEKLDSQYRDSIFINKHNSLQMNIRIISQGAASFPNVKTVTCFNSALENWGFNDDLQMTDEERKKKLKNWLEDKLFIFNVERRLIYNTQQDGVYRQQEVYNAINVRIIHKLPSFTNDLNLIPIPIFSSKSHEYTFDEFFFKLSNGKFIGRVENISHEPEDTPSLIIWKEEGVDEFKIFGEFVQHQYAYGGFNLKEKEGIKESVLKREIADECYYGEFCPDLLFMPLEKYLTLTEEIEKDEKTITPEPIEVVKEQLNETTTPKEITILEKEEDFLKQFMKITKEWGLQYSEEDLVNFHTAMKISSLVILAGMSGTGKSKLVETYGYSLGLKDNLTIIPVSPSWTSDSDLIGFADTLNMVYRPGDSGLINTLIKAERSEKDELFIICFDEMNLARVEHYFSQFLSILEMSKGKRVLRLYNDDLESRLYNSAQFPPTISIGDNVLFVGTVNIDESTYHFSDKVLDRANVLSLEVLPFSGMREISEEKKRARTDEIKLSTYNSFRDQGTDLKLNDDELDFLWDLHNLFQITNKQLGVGPRIVKQIDMYIKNLPNMSSITRGDAFDIQIVQRILTKIRGTGEQLKNLLIETNTKEKSGIIELFDKYEHVSRFYKSREIISQKVEEINYNGYSI